MSPATLFNEPDTGGLHGPPVLGLASIVQLLQASQKDALLHALFSAFLRLFLYLMVTPLALWAWWYNRQEHAWLWLFLALVWVVSNNGMEALSSQTTVVSIADDMWWRGVLVLRWWTMFWWHWFGLREKRWIPRAAWLLAALLTLLQFCAQSPLLGFSFVPQPALHWFNTTVNWVFGSILVAADRHSCRRLSPRSHRGSAGNLPIVLYLYTVFGIYL